jgi:alkanesulfonate monooxygenase SsuD/methylene tetrahydromethanopterin reductase-like flavin-dependent oxidoreductase (luciferase family)
VTSIGLVFPAHAAAEDLPAFAVRAEALGYDELWVIEDCFLSGGLTLATAALAATKRIHVGVGLLPAAVRNAAIVAMEIGTLGRMFPGRLTVAFGHGVESWMAQIDARPAKRLAALSETVTAVRRLLAGETVDAAGSFVSLRSVALDNPPAVPPTILVGTAGPRGIALAGRRAQGLLLPEGCGPTFVADAKQISDAAARTQTAPPRIVAYAWLRIDEDEPARLALTDAVSHWVNSGLFPGPVRAVGVDGPPLAGMPVSRALADELGVVGSADQCAQAVGRFASAGAHSLVVAAIGSDYANQYERFGHEVLPTVGVQPSAAA